LGAAQRDQDNILAAWSWAIDIGNVDTAFSMLAGFAPSEVRTSYLLLLPRRSVARATGRDWAPGLPARPGGQRRVRLGRADRVGAEELCRRAAEANARRDPRTGGRGDHLRSTLKHRDYYRRLRRRRPPVRTGGRYRAGRRRPRRRVPQLAIAAGLQLFVGDDAGAVSLAREALALARQVGAPARIATGLLAVGMAVAQTDPDQARACLRESRELSTRSAIRASWTTSGRSGSRFS
jgi:hypothetical protein